MMPAAIRALPVLVALAGGVGGDVLASNSVPDGARQPRWVEVTWPFPIDQWGGGRAYECSAAACGVTVQLYLRPKLGFCNCAKGVYDDGELDRVGDVALIAPQFVGLGDGQDITVGWMKGRSRAFVVSGPYRPTSAAAAIAFNDKCDVVVATVTADADLPRGVRAALQFLGSDLALRWARAELGAGGS